MKVDRNLHSNKVTYYTESIKMNEKKKIKFEL